MEQHRYNRSRQSSSVSVEAWATVAPREPYTAAPARNRHITTGRTNDGIRTASWCPHTSQISSKRTLHERRVQAEKSKRRLGQPVSALVAAVGPTPDQRAAGKHFFVFTGCRLEVDVSQSPVRGCLTARHLPLLETPGTTQIILLHVVLFE